MGEWGTVVRPCHSVLLPISVSSYLEIWLCRLPVVVVSRFCHLNCNFAAAAKRQTFLAICFCGQGVIPWIWILGLRKESNGVCKLSRETKCHVNFPVPSPPKKIPLSIFCTPSHADRHLRSFIKQYKISLSPSIEVLHQQIMGGFGQGLCWCRVREW